MALSTLIVQRGIATIREVEEALARQVLYGGDLATNLLEVGPVDEAALLGVVAESVGLPTAPVGLLPLADVEVLHLIAAEVAGERSFVPLSIEQGALVIAVADRPSKESLRELSFALSLPIVPRMALHVRIRQAIERAYGVALDRRCERLVARLEGRDVGHTSSLPTHARAELRSPPRPPSHVPPVAIDDPSRRLPTTTAPAPQRPSAKPTGAPPPRDAGSSTFVRDGRAPPERTERRRRGPLTSDVAKKELGEASERDAIFDVVFDFSKQYFDYAAFFTVQSDTAEGRDAFGEGAARERVGRIGVPLEAPGLLSMARLQKTALVMRPSPRGPDAILMGDLGRTDRTECAVVPVVVRGRVVALFLGDGGAEGVDATSLAEVTRVVGFATAAFERLLLQRKQGGVLPRPTEEAAPTGRAAGAAAGPIVRETPRSQTLRSQTPQSQTLQSEPPRSQTPRSELSRGQPPRSQPPRDQPTTPAPPMGTWPTTDELARPVSELAMTLDAEPAPLDPSDSDATLTSPVETEPPPPPNVLVVRRPSGAPIPREEPGIAPSVDEVTPSRSSRRRAEAPPLEFSSAKTPSFEPDPFGSNADERLWMAEIRGDASETVERVESVESVETIDRENDPDATPLAPPVDLSHDPDATPAAPSVSTIDADAPAISAPAAAPPFVANVIFSRTRVMPPSEHRIAVAAHRPPIPRTDGSRELPSIIVDVIPEYASVVAKLLADGGEAEESTLLRGGESAMPAIMQHFPGPVRIDLPLESSSAWPRASECGPILRIIARQRRTALPFVLGYVEDVDAEHRFWATYLLAELAYVEAIDPALHRLFDEEPRVRRAARAALIALADMHPRQTISRLGEVASHEGSPGWQRLVAVDALGATKEPLAVEVLLPMLREDDRSLVEAAHRVLVALTLQDFGESAGRWEAWWREHEQAHRIEWLIDALAHDELANRAVASEELALLTKETFGYADDLPKRDRERAQAKYRAWWSNVGRIRFHRDDTRLR